MKTFFAFSNVKKKTWFFSNEINLKPWPDDNRLRLCELLIRIKVPLNRLIVDPEEVFAASQLLQFICNIMRWIKARGTSFCRHFVNDKSSRPRQPQQSLQKLPVLTKFSITGLESWKKFSNQMRKWLRRKR